MAPSKKEARALVFDMDGVLVDFNTAYAKKLHAIWPEFDIKVAKEPTTWKWDKAAGISKEVIDDAWEMIKEDKEFWPSLKPLVEKKTIEDIFNFSLVMPTYVITSRPDGYTYSIVDATVKSLENIGLPSLGVICADQKELLVEPIGIRFFIDDKMDNVTTVRDAIKRDGAVVALLTAAYNEKEVLPEGVIRVASVDEFLELVYQVIVKEVENGDEEGDESEEGTEGDDRDKPKDD